MFKKLLAFMLALVITLGCLFSCGGGSTGDGEGEGDGTGTGDTPGGDTGNGGDENPGDSDPASNGYLYNLSLDSMPTMVYSPGAKIPSTMTDPVRSALHKIFNRYPAIQSGSSEVAMHEIVIGKTARKISEDAYAKLEKVMKEADDGYVSWLIYSDGNSVAIAFEDDDQFITLEAAVEHLLNEVFADKTALKLRKGTVASGSFSDVDYFKAKDKQVIETAWQRLNDVLTARIGEKDAAAFVDAMQGLYGIYNNSVVRWFANLYDPGVGGYYYSNSGRNTEGYLPDIESTAQALGFWESSGMCRLYGNSYGKGVPTWMRDQIVRFVKGLQDPNGFFYHPQWTKELTDSKISRRARDLGNAEGILRYFGSKPTYNTPNGTGGDGLDVDGNPVSKIELTNPLSTSMITAVSKAVAVAAYAEHLENEETFRAYLEKTKKDKGSFYAVGNQITSEMPQIIARDNQLQAEGATYSLVDITIEFFNAHQDPETGLWSATGKQPANYEGVNGLLKISGVYTKAKAEIPYAEKAAQAAIDAITSEEPISAVVDLYNTWYSIQNVIANLSDFGKTVEVDGKKMTGAERGQAICDALYITSVPAIRKSAEKISAFQKSDGSFSYTKLYSSTTSQGMQVALPNSNEGDVNATVIAINGIKGHIYGALGLNGYQVPLFGESERRMYIDILETLTPVEKYKSDIVLDDPLTFDDDTVGEPSPFITEANLNSPGSYAIVQKDPRGSGNVLAFKTTSFNTGDSVLSNNTIFFPDRSQYVFEGEFMIPKDGAVSGTSFQLFMKRAYMLTINIDVSKDTVTICENTYNSWKFTKETKLATLKLDEWFKLRLEYYPPIEGTSDDTRIKVYVNDKLIHVSNNYYGKHATPQGTPGTDISYSQIFALSTAQAVLYMDNLHTYTQDTVYIPETATDLVYNVDLELPEKTYDFDGLTALPDDLNADGVVLTDVTGGKALTVKRGTFSTKINQVNADPDTYTFKAKLSDFNMTKGDTLTVAFSETTRGVIPMTIEMKMEDGGICFYEGAKKVKIENALLKTDKAAELTISITGNKITISVDSTVLATATCSHELYKIYQLELLTVTYVGAGSVVFDNVGFNATKSAK